MSRDKLLKNLATPAVVAAVLALLAGCGSSSTTTSTTSATTGTTAPTAELEKYRAELKPKNEAVESARHNFEQVRFTGGNYSELEAAFRTYINALNTYLKALEQTQPPVAVASAAQSYISHLRQHLGDVEQALKSAEAHDTAALTADLEKAHASAKECSVASNFYAEACRW
jgi:hypothetical protein